ncbi:MAG: GH36 C-terminal domain-containing protein, partial [Oscillospiraceae bacterium]|nr:GH36 C-terminal domain-containing protein [Oscillospiraceae bacterium]
FWEIIYASDEPTVTKALTNGTLKNIGFECLEIDYGWWGTASRLPDGTDIVEPVSMEASPRLFPCGMGHIGRLAADNGIKFNLYFCNMVQKNTKEEFARKYREYHMDFWRDDGGRADIEVLDWLAANIPNYRYENCNSGGVNKDFATYMRATTGCCTDMYVNPLQVRQTFYTTSYIICPAQINTCQQIGYLAPGIKAKLDETTDQFTYCLRSGMLGQVFAAICAVGPGPNPGNIILPDDEPLTIPIYTKNIAIYKEFLRPLIREGNVYHILPRPDSANSRVENGVVTWNGVTEWDGIEYYDPDTRKGALMLFKTMDEYDSKNILLKGLEPEVEYTLEFTDRPRQNVTMTGAVLMTDGLPVTMTGEFTSEIVLFSPVSTVG